LDESPIGGADVQKRFGLTTIMSAIDAQDFREGERKMAPTPRVIPLSGTRSVDAITIEIVRAEWCNLARHV
jgi:hypothetical protein